MYHINLVNRISSNQPLGFLPSFKPRHGKYGNPVGELLTRSKQGSQLYYEVLKQPFGLDLVQPMVRCSCSWCGMMGKFPISLVKFDIWIIFGYGKIFTGIPGFKPWCVVFLPTSSNFWCSWDLQSWVVTIGKKQRSYGAGHPFLDARRPPQQHQILKDLGQPLYRNLSGMPVEYSLNFI